MNNKRHYFTLALIIGGILAEVLYWLPDTIETIKSIL